MQYSNEEHKRIIEEANQLKESGKLSAGNEANLEVEITRNLMTDPKYSALSKNEGLVSGRASAFETLYNMVGLYNEGEPVSGCYLFTSLRKNRVFAAGLTYGENIESFDLLLENLASKDKKKVEAFKATAMILKREVIPYLQEWTLKNMMSEKIGIDTYKAYVERVKSKKGNR